MLIYSVISPHPPIILPEIGGQRIKIVEKTIQALKAAAIQLAAAKPERLVIISPHREHGYNVPLYYLAQNLSPQIEIEKILVSQPSYRYYFDLGQQYGQFIDQSEKRTAVIASADLSHVLKHEGPYGFHPAGPKLDRLIVKAVEEKDADSLLDIDNDVLECGAECGLRSILFLFGVFDGRDYETEVLSYEGPFGVGYMVASFAVRTG